MELIKRELANTSVKISIEALEIIVCKCTKDCFRYYVQKPDFTITRAWLNSFIEQNKLDEKYSVKQKPHFTFSTKYKDEKDSTVNFADQREQSYVTLPSSGIKIYINPQANKNPLKSVDEVIDSIAKNGIPSYLNVCFLFYYLIFNFVAFCLLVIITC